ncbi:flagellar biosynthetic protein FliO [Achromobacter sp. SLBN-14]|uniref:flagellar biosynthetic protein FliO n=1 Tax=Achromobacter sp. SLBN-14 TaxID=2768442 RepID=UPI001151282B|nr:flagellar biosynthetic protein FliO [Achromobacter sp. SLBN-14]TQJ96176.1 hypothetical protein FBY20_2952 [Achromobacter sp. SLBN-14]
MSPGTPLAWARDGALTSGLQSWSWALAIVLALLACVSVLWCRKRGGIRNWAKPAIPPVRSLGGTRLNQNVRLEVVEFGGQRILLSVSQTEAREIARDALPGDAEGSVS